MRELSREGFLGERLRAGTAGEREIGQVAEVLAAFYQKQERTPEISGWGKVGKLRISTDENFAQTAGLIGVTVSQGAFEAIRGFVDACYERRRGVFEKRVADGWIRDCHGDLHLEHVHVEDGVVRIYDCIEFNDRFRYVDIASDVAFLAMDLDDHGYPALGRLLVERLAELMGDRQLPEVLDFYQCYRAYVRGKVESLRSVAELADDRGREDAAADARRYFQLALQYAVCGTSPVVLVVMGRVASGKSTLALELGRELGWRVISSDERRKCLAGVPLHERGDERVRSRLYAPEMTGRTYDSLIRDAREALQAGHGLILDATFSRRVFRDRLREALGDANVRWILASVDRATAADRLREREGRVDVVSDARSGEQPMLDAVFEAPDELPPGVVFPISTAGQPDQVAGRLLACLAVGR
jgi:predicted kinase